MRLQKIRRTILFFSFLLFPFTFMYLSPYIAVMGTIAGVAASGLLFWGLFGVTSVALGRSACGWICPLGGIQRSLDSQIEKPLRTIRYVKIVKYAIWAAWIGAIAAIAVVKGGYHKVDVLFMNETGFPPYPLDAYIAMLSFMLLAAVPALVWGRRAFCHYLCFFSPLNILGTALGRKLRLPALSVRVKDKTTCKNCHLCDKSCPMSLEVEKMVSQGAIDHLECITCGMCSAVCRHGALKYGFGGKS